jgi:CheY-like chemotaxis protein
MSGNGAAAPARRLKVLVVEDELLIADYLAMLFEEAGHEVAGTAATAEDALAMLHPGHAVDLVSLDVRLPGRMDGVDLACRLRDDAGPPFLFITGSGDPDHRARCEATHPLAILQKPVNAEALERVLERVSADLAGQRP